MTVAHKNNRLQITDHTLHVGAEYKKRDNKTEEMESFIIDVQDDSSSSSESDESMGVEYLESDFDNSE